MNATFQEMKNNLMRDYMIRRYQKIVKGEVLIEERAIESLTRMKFQVANSWRIIIKRALDISVSLLGLIACSPVMALVALAVKLDSRGPILYSQERVGQKGRTFRIYKFRTMRLDAELKSGPVWAVDNDPRVTAVGHFLRVTHLDELPQFFNVLKGEMSLVGPRPERPHFVKELKKHIPNYDMRLYAKPGVTGLAQIRQRYDNSIEDVRRKVRYDVLYIKKMCPLLDVKVIALTALTVILRTGR